jgi:hypothetical protein
MEYGRELIQSNHFVDLTQNIAQEQPNSLAVSRQCRLV